MTKREIMSSIHSNFDPFGTCIPILNRSRLFLHNLHLDKTVGWDTPLGVERAKEWSNIAKQVNKSNEITLPRSVGDRAGSYNLSVYTDASKEFLGSAIYLSSVIFNTCKECLGF